MAKHKRLQLRVTSPQPNDSVFPLTYKAGEKEFFFITVSGRASAIDKLVACLIAQDSGKPPNPPDIYPGRVVRDGTHWAVAFEGLPKTADARSYRLFIAQTGTNAAGNFTATLEFAIDPKRPADTEPKFRDIPILFPLSNATVPATFAAAGSVAGDVVPTTATMTGGVTVNATSVNSGSNGVPVGVWVATFDNVPDGAGYTLTVAKGDLKGASTNITVDSLGLPPVLGNPPPPPQGND